MTGVDDAVREQMRAAGCREIVGISDGREDRYCHEHGGDWDTGRDECPVVGSAVRSGYRAAIEAAREIVRPAFVIHYQTLSDRIPEVEVNQSLHRAADRIDALMPTTTEQDKTDD